MFQTVTRQLEPPQQLDMHSAARHLMLHLRTPRGRCILPLPDIDDQRLIFGRIDPGRESTVNIDLTHCEGRELGVSRLHAMIDLSGIPTLTDMNSANGTFLNGERLIPFEVRRLFNGDVICLGMLVLYVTLE